MQEAQRQAYLEAMGVATYFPRVQLEAAPVVGQASNDATEPEHIEEQPTVTVQSPVAVPALDSTAIARAPTERKAPEVNISGSSAAASLQQVRRIVDEPISSAEVIPSFNYRLVFGNNLILLNTVDINQEAGHRFLRNLSIATVIGSRAAIQDEVFAWPDKGLPKGTNKDKQAATEALTHNILGKAVRTEAKVCIIFGDSEFLSQAELEQDLKLIRVGPISAFLQSPDSKRKLWLQICKALAGS